MPADVHVVYEDVRKSYDGSSWVVHGLDLEVRRGEFLTLLGPSGSGKTTCLMMLAGFEAATEGTIRIDGESVQDLPPDKRGIGVVFQNYALFPHMSVAGNLAFPLEVRGMGPAERAERVARALRLVRLEGMEARRPGQLSGGQQQRVAIARALVFEPELVLMDEPLGALDRRLREEMQYEIRRIQRELGVTVVYVTHDQQEAMVLSDRVAVFNEGRIEQIDPPEVLYEEPERAFVARFIKVGEPTTMAIRPERVGVGGPPDRFANEFEATVDEITFLGDHLRVSLSIGEIKDFVAKIPNVTGQGGVLEGDRVRLGWAALNCRALEAAPQVPTSQ